MQKKHLGIAAAIGIIIIGGILLKKGPSSHSDAENPQNEEANPSADTATADGISQPAHGTASQVSGVSSLSAPVAQIGWTPEVKAQLQSFQNLQLKSVMTPDEEKARLEMLKDGDLIAKIAVTLRSRAAQKDPQYEEKQNEAIDFLVEALKEGNEQAATDAIWDQIRDNQVEDMNIPLKERQVLAGIKGELLYHATALRPDTFQDVDMDLPGPVSQKIWQNVQEQHRANLEGSQLEVDEHAKKHGGGK